MLQPVQLFKILSDETRLAIVMLLRESGELCVCDICVATSESQPKISRHMAILREADLVFTDAGTGDLATQRPEYWLEREYRGCAGAGNRCHPYL